MEENEERGRGERALEEGATRGTLYKVLSSVEIQAKQEPHKTSSHPVLSPLPTERKWFIGS